MDILWWMNTAITLIHGTFIHCATQIKLVEGRCVSVNKKSSCKELCASPVTRVERQEWGPGCCLCLCALCIMFHPTVPCSPGHSEKLWRREPEEGDVISAEADPSGQAHIAGKLLGMQKAQGMGQVGLSTELSSAAPAEELSPRLPCSSPPHSLHSWGIPAISAGICSKETGQEPHPSCASGWLCCASLAECVVSQQSKGTWRCPRVRSYPLDLFFSSWRPSVSHCLGREFRDLLSGLTYLLTWHE